MIVDDCYSQSLHPILWPSRCPQHRNPGLQANRHARLRPMPGINDLMGTVGGTAHLVHPCQILENLEIFQVCVIPFMGHAAKQNP